MNSYLQLLREVRDHGVQRPDRTGTGVYSLFGRQLHFDLAAGFPLLTTKQVYFHAIVEELLWFMRGETNVRTLQKRGVNIWNEWADADGELGPVYGAQWRSWRTADGRTIDQLQQLLELLEHQPESRRLLVSSWNVGELERMALPPCHVLFQFYVAAGRLSCQVYQRSVDVFLGLPFNIASYALLTSLVAQVSNFQPGALVHTLGDVHLYQNHREQADAQLQREPYPLPRLQLDADVQDLFSFDSQHIQLAGYRCHPALPAPIAV